MTCMGTKMFFARKSRPPPPQVSTPVLTWFKNLTGPPPNMQVSTPCTNLFEKNYGYHLPNSNFNILGPEWGTSPVHFIVHEALLFTLNNLIDFYLSSYKIK